MHRVATAAMKLWRFATSDMQQQRLSQMIAALWWGAISGMSFVAVPLMFANLGPAMAGPVAAKLFSLQCWMSLGFGLSLLLLVRRRKREAVLTDLHLSEASVDGLAARQFVLGTMVILPMLLALVQEFGVAQKIITAKASGGNFRLWHFVGILLVLGQWLCAGSVLWRITVEPSSV